MADDRRWDALRDLVERSLTDLIESRYRSDCPVGEVTRYVMEGRGKRVRGVLALMAAEACGAGVDVAIPAACALEMVHAYSLVHDDLPCMDNDDERRGRPTAHRRFDEARALLAGDALLTDAFAVLVGGAGDAGDRVRSVRELARAAGGHGMVRGQALDLYWTGRGGWTRADLDRIHRHKTGCLLAAACALGAIAAGADEARVEAFREFGFGVGLVFQIVDDLLDVAEGTGKGRGKDARDGKLTYLGVMGADDARGEAARINDETMARFRAVVGSSGDVMIESARRLLGRQV